MFLRKAVYMIILCLILSSGEGSIALCADEKSAMPPEDKTVVLTVDEAVTIALRDNRDVLLKAEDVKKAKLKIAENQGILFPSLTFTGTWTDTRGYYKKDLSQSTAQATLKEYLYRGAKTINTIKQSEYKFGVAQALLDKTKLETVLGVKKAFYTFLLSKEFTALNKAILENTELHLDLIKARYESGEASGSDILQIESSLDAVKQAYEASQNQTEASSALLKNLLYLDEGMNLKPDGQFIYEGRAVAYDEAFLKALKMRPEIRQYEAQGKADERAVEIAKADNRPSIYASWDYYSRSHTSATTNRGWNDYNVIGLTFSWPVFDGWTTKAKVEQAIVDLKETRLNKDKVTRDIALELKDAYLVLKDAIAKLTAVETDIKLFNDNLSTVEQKYKEGIASFTDTDDARLKYEVSLFNKRQAIYDYLIAGFAFDKATGGS